MKRLTALWQKCQYGKMIWSQRVWRWTWGKPKLWSQVEISIHCKVLVDILVYYAEKVSGSSVADVCFGFTKNVLIPGTLVEEDPDFWCRRCLGNVPAIDGSPTCWWQAWCSWQFCLSLWLYLSRSRLWSCLYLKMPLCVGKI